MHMKRFSLIKRNRQTTEYSCGACSLQTVMSYWGVNVDETELMQLLGTTPEDGTYPEDMVRVARAKGLTAALRSNLTLEDLQVALADGHPVIVLGQAWRSQASADASWGDEWDNGHWFILLAIDEDYVYFEDPYVRMGKGFIPRATFEDSWHNVMGGDRSKPEQIHMGIFIRGDKPAQTASRTLDLESFDFTEFGSLNLIVAQLKADVPPYDFMTELKQSLDASLLRADAFIFMRRGRESGLTVIGGSRLENEHEIIEVNAILGALARLEAGTVEKLAAGSEMFGRAAHMGDFGLPETELQRIADKILPDHSAIILLIENLWERKFREVARKYGGQVIRQRLVSSEELIEFGQQLKESLTYSGN